MLRVALMSPVVLSRLSCTPVSFKVVSLTLKGLRLEVPALGVVTLIWTFLGEAIREAGTAALSWVAETKVVLSGVVEAPSIQLTEEVSRKAAPLTIKVKAGPAALTEPGCRPLSVGGGIKWTFSWNRVPRPFCPPAEVVP